MTQAERIELLLTKVPLLSSVLERLDEQNIPWMIGGSGCLFLLGNERLPDDVDIFLRSEDHDKANQIFGIEPFEYKSPLEVVRNSNPEGNHDVQLTSGLQIIVDGKSYDFSIGPEIIENRLVLESGSGRKMWLMPPEDVLLIKAVLRRGVEVGKHDLEDVSNFLKIYSPRESYLSGRIQSLGAAERVGNAFIAG